jgi:predicted DNA-binding transcriptional regulator AlpA
LLIATDDKDIQVNANLPPPSGGKADAEIAQCKAASSWVNSAELAADLGITQRTLDRWLRDVVLGFPRPRWVGVIRHFDRAEIEAWKASRPVATTLREVAQ